MTIEAPTDGEIFLAYLEQVLGPQLQPGDVVVMDNLAAHKVAGVRESIQGRGPSSSICHPTRPTSTPSNRAGLRSSNLRTAKARSLPALCLADALAAVTPTFKLASATATTDYEIRSSRQDERKQDVRIPGSRDDRPGILIELRGGNERGELLGERRLSTTLPSLRKSTVGIERIANC